MCVCVRGGVGEKETERDRDSLALDWVLMGESLSR